MTIKYAPIPTSSGSHRKKKSEKIEYGDGGARGWTIFAIAAASLVLMNSAFSITLTVIPDIARDFDDLESKAIWIVTSSNLASTCLQPASGKLGDVFGHSLIWMLGMILRISSFVVSGFAPNLNMLILSSTFSGIGSALDGPSGLALVVRSFPESMRPILISIMTATGTTSQTIGLLAGGVIASKYGWRFLFFGPVPFLTIIALVAGLVLWWPNRTQNTTKEHDLDELDSSHGSGNITSRPRLELLQLRNNDNKKDIENKLTENGHVHILTDLQSIPLDDDSNNCPGSSNENNSLHNKANGYSQNIIQKRGDGNPLQLENSAVEPVNVAHEDVDDYDFAREILEQSWKTTLMKFDWMGTFLLLLVSMQFILCISFTLSPDAINDESVHSMVRFIRNFFNPNINGNGDSDGSKQVRVDRDYDMLYYILSSLSLVVLWAGFAFLTLVMVVVEKAHHQPILPPEIFRVPLLAGCVIDNIFLWIPYMGTWLLMPLFMRDHLQMSPGKVAGILVVRPIFNGIIGSLSGFVIKYCENWGKKQHHLNKSSTGSSREASVKPGGEGPITAALLITSWSIQLVSYVLLVLYIAPPHYLAHRPVFLLEVACALMGAGTGLANNSLVSLAAAESPQHMLGGTLGVLRMGQGLASLLSWAGVGAVVSSGSGLSPYKNTALAFVAFHICSVVYPIWLIIRALRSKFR